MSRKACTTKYRITKRIYFVMNTNFIFTTTGQRWQERQCTSVRFEMKHEHDTTSQALKDNAT